MANTLTKSEPTAKEATPEATGDTASQKETETATNSAAVPHARKRKWLWIVGVVAAAAVCVVGIPWVREMMNTISTDDAYVNGNVTYVAPRVSGQVANVFVNENNVVRKGDLLIELDSEPYQVQVNIAQAAVDAAKAELVAAKAQVNGLQAQVRSYQFNMKHAIEDVHNKVAELRGHRSGARNRKGQAGAGRRPIISRALSLQKANPGAISRQDVDEYQEAFRVARAQINQALEHVHQIRVSLGLPATPPSGDDLGPSTRRPGPNLQWRSRSAGQIDASGRSAGRERAVQ